MGNAKLGLDVHLVGLHLPQGTPSAAHEVFLYSPGMLSSAMPSPCVRNAKVIACSGQPCGRDASTRVTIHRGVPFASLNVLP